MDGSEAQWERKRPEILFLSGYLLGILTREQCFRVAHFKPPFVVRSEQPFPQIAHSIIGG